MLAAAFAVINIMFVWYLEILERERINYSMRRNVIAQAMLHLQCLGSTLLGLQLLSKCFQFKTFSLSSEGKLDHHFVNYMHSHLIHENIVTLPN